MRHAKSIIPLLVLLLFPVILCRAELPPADPILRIETGMHTVNIWRISADARGRWLVTASDDKSLRVWELPTGRLARIIRPPIGFGNEGKLYSVAMSPDGRMVACGGWTRLGSEQGNIIYIFDRASGRLVSRITGQPDVINHLAFSPDGRFLAAALGANNGVRLFSVSGWFQTGEDRFYGDVCIFASFSGDGRLVTASRDGFIRLYGVWSGALRLISRVKSPGGNQPYGVYFSPDGGRVAVGHVDTANVAVLSGRDLSLLYFADTRGVTNGNLASVAWSADGRYLYAGGQYQSRFGGAWGDVIRRWSDGGRGAYSDNYAASNTIMDMAPLPAGQMAFCTGEPSFGLLDRSGKRTLFVPPAIADYRSAWEKLTVSVNGGAVGFGYKSWGAFPAYFDLATRNLTHGSAPATLSPPRSMAPGLTVDGWKDGFQPKVNGAPLRLEPFEMSRALAIAPDGATFVLGTGWWLRCFDSRGNQRWSAPVPAEVRAVNITAGGSLVVAAYADGTIRWHRLSDGRELLAFFPHGDRKRWVLWTPSGYYDASPGGEELIGWHVNNGESSAADFFPASQFRSSKYRPDLIARVLETLDENEAVRLANEESGKKQAVESVARLLPPVVGIISPEDGAGVSSRNVTIAYTIRTPDDAPVTGVRILVDGRPVSGGRGIAVRPRDGGEQRVTVTIPEQDCEVGLIAENRHSASLPATVRLSWKGRTQAAFIAQPRLYALAIGVSAYRDPGLTLKYAAKDARDFAAAIQKQKGGLYRDVTVKVLADAQATRDDVMDGLDWLQKEVTAKDVGIIFIAGHGVNDQTGIYYFLPQNADTERLKRSGVAFTDIKNTLASLAGKAVLFVDTCHSGNVMGSRRGVADINALVNELSSSENGAVVFASSTGRQYSLEDERWGNGAFTKALVEGLSGKADYSGKGKITINMLDLYLSERVKELTRGRQTPTTTKPRTIQDFPIAVKK